jgi:hypothetical protein
MIAGDTTRRYSKPYQLIHPGSDTYRTYNPNNQSDQAILFDGGSGEKPGFPKVLNKNFQMNVRFQSCWDGVNVDSPDHKSHVRAN